MVQKWYNMEMEIIIYLLKYEKVHVRQLAKDLKQSHATISRVLNRLTDSKIINYNFEGNNKVYCLKKGIETLNAVYTAEHYKLMKLIKKYPEISVIIEDIIRKIKEKMIIIFGSYAKFNVKKDSDIDLFIETNNNRIRGEANKINTRINTKIGIFDINNPLAREIIKDHVIIKGVEYFYEKNPIFK